MSPTLTGRPWRSPSGTVTITPLGEVELRTLIADGYVPTDSTLEDFLLLSSSSMRHLRQPNQRQHHPADPEPDRPAIIENLFGGHPTDL